MKSPFLHPFCFALFVPLAFMAANSNRFPLSVLVLPVAVIFTSVLLVLIFANLTVKDMHRVSIFISANSLYFFSYGYLSDIFKNIRFSFLWLEFGYNKILIIIWLLLLLILTLFLRTRKRGHAAFTRFLNVSGSILITLSLLRLAFAEFQNDTTPVEPIATQYPGQFSQSESPPENPPDIIHIILDAYPRSDILKETFLHDNGSFEDFLRTRGFHINKKSYSNYISTDQSLASMYNMDYLHNLFPHANPQSSDYKPLIDIKMQGKVFTFLRKNGYRSVYLANGLESVEPQHVDMFLSPTGSVMGLYLNHFQAPLLHLTPLPLLNSLFKSSILDEHKAHRERILFAFDFLKNSHTISGPKYLLVHLISPHDPLIFGPDGEHRDVGFSYWELLENDPDKLIDAFRDQVIFMNKEVIETVESILDNNPQHPPVVLIQSDHGSSMIAPLDEHPCKNFLRERFGVFNAVYLPSQDYSGWYDNITLVNTFRVLFNDLFKMDLPTKEDRIYFTSTKLPYDYFEITDSLVRKD